MSELKKYNLFLDDFRNPEDVYAYIKNAKYNGDNWIVVRSYDEFVNQITEGFKNSEFPGLISFDHDLADEHYDLNILYEIDYNSYKEKTGYDCAKFIIAFCSSLNLDLPDYLIHSMNTIGKLNIESLLKSYLKSKEI